MRIGYGRVSTREQNLDAQRDALTAAGCERVFVDSASGKLASRPQLEQALAVARAGDQLVVLCIGEIVLEHARPARETVGVRILEPRARHLEIGCRELPESDRTRHTPDGAGLLGGTSGAAVMHRRAV